MKINNLKTIITTIIILSFIGLFSSCASQSAKINSVGQYQNDKIIVSVTRFTGDYLKGNFIVIIDESGNVLKTIEIDDSILFADLYSGKSKKKNNKSNEAIINLDY